jgi:PST family polysaccharide transporter
MSKMGKLLPSFISDNLNRHPDLKHILLNIGWLSFDRVLRMGVGLFIGVWVARYLGPEQFGLFNYAIAFVALFSSFATLGLDNIVIRDIVRDPSCKYETLGTAFILKFLGSGLTLLLAISVIYFLHPDNSLMQWSVGIIAAATIFQSIDVIDFWFQSQIQSKYTVWARNIAFILIALLRVMLIQMHAPLIAFVFASSLEIVLAAIGLLVTYRSLKEQRLKSWRFNFPRAKLLLKNSWPLMISGMAIMLYMKIDIVMLGEMVGDREVGIYAAATRFSELWYFIPMAITSSVFPSIIEARKIDEIKYYNRLQKLFDLMTGLALAIAIPMTFLSNFVIRILYANNYVGAGPILAIHIWAALFVFLGVAQSPWDITEGLTKLAMIRTLIGAFINISLNILLLPLYAGLGAAIATVVAYAVSGCLANVIDKRSRRIFILQMKSLFLLRYFYRIP